MSREKCEASLRIRTNTPCSFLSRWSYIRDIIGYLGNAVNNQYPSIWGDDGTSSRNIITDAPHAVRLIDWLIDCQVNLGASHQTNPSRQFIIIRRVDSAGLSFIPILLVFDRYQDFFGAGIGSAVDHGYGNRYWERGEGRGRVFLLYVCIVSYMDKSGITTEKRTTFWYRLLYPFSFSTLTALPWGMIAPAFAE